MQEGVGVGFVSKMVVEKINKDNVAVINLRGINLHREIYIGFQKKRPASAAQNAFWEFIRRDYPGLGRSLSP